MAQGVIALPYVHACINYIIYVQFWFNFYDTFFLLFFCVRFFISGCLLRPSILLHGYFSTHQIFAAQQYVWFLCCFRFLFSYIIPKLAIPWWSSRNSNHKMSISCKSEFVDISNNWTHIIFVHLIELHISFVAARSMYTSFLWWTSRAQCPAPKWSSFSPSIQL